MADESLDVEFLNPEPTNKKDVEQPIEAFASLTPATAGITSHILSLFFNLCQIIKIFYLTLYRLPSFVLKVLIESLVAQIEKSPSTKRIQKKTNGSHHFSII